MRPAPACLHTCRYHCCRAAYPYLKASGGGKIILMSRWANCRAWAGPSWGCSALVGQRGVGWTGRGRCGSKHERTVEGCNPQPCTSPPACACKPETCCLLQSEGASTAGHPGVTVAPPPPPSTTTITHTHHPHPRDAALLAFAGLVPRQEGVSQRPRLGLRPTRGGPAQLLSTTAGSSHAPCLGLTATHQRILVLLPCLL